jgi:hypothetical protein
MSTITIKTVLAISVLAILASAAAASTPYVEGFTWNRYDDWTPGTSNGSSAGNPMPDAAGNPVWSHEYIQGVPAGADLDTTDGVAPWYTLPSDGLMVWDSHWSGGTWARLYDYPPTAPRVALGHIPANNSYHGDHYANVPLLRWDNPSATPIAVSLTSDSSFLGQLDIGIPTGTTADFVIVRTDASDGS